ncbi:MAG: ADP-ribose pyrophosphatase [Peptococcaceae bacterium BRH_c4a]|nr:MAG: ADP-ribose pyrophosphatase [Peptococcaceae bacterium BRH_c4a]
MDFTEKKVSSETVYKGKILNLRVDDVELPNGKITKREVVEHAGAVAVVPLDEKNELLLVRQYRYPVGKMLLEVPAGKLEKGEDPEACAVRELAEETGCRAKDMKLLFSFYSTPGFSNEKMYVYLARGLTYLGEHPDEDEFIEASPVPLQAALDLIDRGEICDAKSIIGILAVKREMDK